MKITDILKTVTSINNSAFFYTPPIYKNGKSILFKNSVESLIAKTKEEFFENLERVNKYLNDGLLGYGSINYEAGYLLEEKLNPLFAASEENIFSFYFFKPDQVLHFTQIEIDYSEVPEIIKEKKYEIDNFRLNTSKELYTDNINKIRQFIKDGDTYQVNYTVKGKFNFSGNIESLFLNLVFNQSAEYSAIINSNDKFIISISPELFFEAEDNKITARPMKGTIKRGYNSKEDTKRKQQLYESKKDRAENVMIVDLLRNDLGRISNYNSVNVTSPYDIEKYESLFQMTSSVEGELSEINFSKIIKNIFPCGSITGAPKIRTMEIINELETESRGIYTGAIGIIEKDKFKFNVPIRTIQISKKGKGEIGLGSGVVWDSNPETEYDETLLKAKFLTNPEDYFELFESILIEKRKPFLLEEHLNRLQNAAGYFSFNFDREIVHSAIMEYCKQLAATINYKMKVSLDKWGRVEIQNSEIFPSNEKVKIVISEKMIDSKNNFQYFKTTNRNLYDEELEKYKAKGFYEVIFLNESNEITEGSFTNIFIKKDNQWFTPLVNSGILNGVYRDYLLKQNNYYEKVVSLKDIKTADEIILVNSVRKKILVDEVISNL